MTSKLCLFVFIAAVLATFVVILYSLRTGHVRPHQPKPAPTAEEDDAQSLSTQGPGSTEDGGQLSTKKPARPRQGYVLALHFSDQVTAATANVLSLQCWAEQSNLLVAEPFVIHSWLGASLKTGREGSEENAVRLSDVFDIDVWQRHSREKGYSRLVSWEEFLSNAPRDVIIASQPPSGDCNLVNFENNSSPFLALHNFTVSRKVCFNFRKSGALPSKQFFARLYGPLSPHETTVIFDRWGGIQADTGSVWRMAVTGNNCLRKVYEITYAAKKSKLILDDGTNYISSFLGGNHTYTAVMIRFEYFFINHHLNSQSPEEQYSLIDGCLRDIQSVWHRLKEEHSLQNVVVLTMDYGKHGSHHKSGAGAASSRFSSYPWMREKVEVLFTDIYGSSLSMQEWERSFEAVAQRNSSGYIAQLQKELAARAQCLLQAGANGMSTFQQQAKVLFDKYHSRSKVNCFAKACN